MAASQIGQLQRELQALERTSKVERDLQTAQEPIGTVERDLQIAQERTSKAERDLQQATNEVERLTLERDFYSKKGCPYIDDDGEQVADSTVISGLKKTGHEIEMTVNPRINAASKLSQGA